MARLAKRGFLLFIGIVMLLGLFPAVSRNANGRRKNRPPQLIARLARQPVFTKSICNGLHQAATSSQKLEARAWCCNVRSACNPRTAPDHLMKRAKIAAVKRGSSLRDFVAEALRRSLAESSGAERHRMTEAPIKLPPGHTIPIRSNEELEQIFEPGDVRRSNSA